MTRKSIVMKIALLISMSLSLLNVAATSGGKTTKVYGLSLNSQPGIVQFELENPQRFKLLYPLEENEIASAGAYANGRYLAMILNKQQKPLGLYAYNLQTGKRSLIKDMKNEASFYTDMTYNYKDETLYALWYEYPNTLLMKVDISTGEQSIISTYESKSIFSIAASPEGKIYAISANGQLYTVEGTNGTLTELFNLHNYCNSLQSISFDFNSNRLYWLAKPYDITNFYEIDLETQNVIPMGEIPQEYQVGGLHLAYTNATEESPKAIGEIEAIQNKSLKPQLTWTNPTLRINEQKLESISRVEIYRNDQLAQTLTDIVPGTQSTWIDSEGVNRINDYKLISYDNNNLEGYPIWVSCFSGEDVPGTPQNLKVTKIDKTSATIEWEAPTKGLNNAWFDTTSLNYKIVRYPDQKTIVRNLNKTLYTDKDVTSYANYTYQVIASNGHGEGGTAQTTSVSLGESIIPPFVSTFEDEESFNMWSVYNEDSNEDCWKWSTTDYSEGCAASKSYFVPYISVDNWLISPPLYLEEGINYELSFTAFTSYYQAESFRITLGETGKPEGQTTIIDDKSVTNYYGEKITVTLPTITKSGIYHIGFEHYAHTSDHMILEINQVKLKEKDISEISGTIHNAQSDVLTDAEITLSGKDNYTTRTDKDGRYKINRVKQGNYEISIDAKGYQLHKEQITIVAGIPFVKDVTLNPREKFEVTGKICDIQQKPIDGVRITLSGYEFQQTTTDASGNYSLTGVCESDQYTLCIEKNYFEPITKKLDIHSNRTQETVVLTTKNIPPYAVIAENDSLQSDVQATIRWTRPIDLKEYAYDNGNPNTSIGYNEGKDHHIIGCIYREPTVVHKVKWYTCSGEKSPYVHVYIINLDKNGEPTGELLFAQKEVMTNDETWTTFELPQPVSAPNGFMVALSGEGNILLARDNNPEIISNRTICYSIDYLYPSGYIYFEQNQWEGGVLLRAEGERIEKSSYIVPIDYGVWRFKKEYLANPDKWTCLKEQVTTTEFQDESLKNESQGEFYYAVKTHYTMNDVNSDFTLSNLIANKLFTSLEVAIQTNSEPQDAEGAQVELTDNIDNSYRATIENGKAIFPKLKKNSYTITIRQEGFETIQEQINLNEQTQYKKDYTLIQILARVRNIDLIQEEPKNNYTLTWDQFDNISDDFEGDCYEDFTINPQGEVGWQYIDNDHKPTYGFGSTTFPNMREQMAAILFNSNYTEPQLQINTAHSGEHALAFFAARPTEDESGVTVNFSDDYLISPTLNFHKDFIFTFFARSYNNDNGLERIRVGYSLGEANLESFIWIDEDYKDVPTEYTEYTYCIPKDAKYVTLNSSSLNAFLLLVDDIFIGTDMVSSKEKSGKGSFNQYKIYLDNICIASTKDKEYKLKDVETGAHVAAVTKEYKSGESKPLSIDFVVDKADGTTNQTIFFNIYVNDDKKLIVDGTYTSLRVYDVTGKIVSAHNQNEPVIDLSELEAGVYIVKGNTQDNHSETVKIQLK